MAQRHSLVIIIITGPGRKPVELYPVGLVGLVLEVQRALGGDRLGRGLEAVAERGDSALVRNRRPLRDVATDVQLGQTAAVLVEQDEVTFAQVTAPLAARTAPRTRAIRNRLVMLITTAQPTAY